MKAILVFCFTAVALAGCASHQQGKAYWSLSEESFAPITSSTTKDDVERLMGKPLLASTFPRQGEEVWDYRYLDGVRVYVAEVHFDLQGRTKYYTTYPDHCSQHPLACR